MLVYAIYYITYVCQINCQCVYPFSIDNNIERSADHEIHWISLGTIRIKNVYGIV